MDLVSCNDCHLCSSGLSCSGAPPQGEGGGGGGAGEVRRGGGAGEGRRGGGASLCATTGTWVCAFSKLSLLLTSLVHTPQHIQFTDAKERKKEPVQFIFDPM